MTRFKLLLCTFVFVLSGVAATLLPATASAASKPTSCTKRVFRTSARKDACVQHLQNMLNGANNAGLTPDKKFGSKTKAAVKNWQKKEMITVDGVVGPDTWGTLCLQADQFGSDYKKLTEQVGCKGRQTCVQRVFAMWRNSHSACVVGIQGMLNTINNGGLNEGKFDSKTKAAVIAWQKKQKQTNKKMKVDGIVGPQTWKTLCAHSGDQTYDALKNLVGCK
jgi:peptidoglycan hydrolase-like protein with peptidoglycan-binding domain